MKCTVNIECTPEEARTFFGLPDPQPMQARMLAEMERRMMAELDRFSPEAVLKAWASFTPQSPEQIRDWIGGLFQAAAPRG